MPEKIVFRRKLRFMRSKIVDKVPDLQYNSSIVHFLLEPDGQKGMFQGRSEGPFPEKKEGKLMKVYRSLVKGYVQTLQINMQKDRKTALKINAGGGIVGVIMQSNGGIVWNRNGT